MVRRAGFLKEGQLPFSFTYQGKPSAELLKSWKTERQQRELDANRVEHTIVWMDPETGLELLCVAIEYRDFPTVEWTLRFRNSGLQPTPILADIQGIEPRMAAARRRRVHVAPQHREPVLGPRLRAARHAAGSQGGHAHSTTSGGRSTNSDLPYFNIEWPGGGAIVVLGWPGQWAAEFNRDEAAGLRVRGGQELTHFKLLPGEEVRSPLVVVQFWKGDRLRAHNVWRRWMLAHNPPHFDGKPMPPVLHHVHLRLLSRHEEQRGRRDQVCRCLLQRRLQLRLLVDRRRLVPLRRRLGPSGHLGARGGSLSQGPSRSGRPRARQGHEVYRLVRARAGPGGTFLAEKHPDWVLGGAGRTAEPRQLRRRGNG